MLRLSQELGQPVLDAQGVRRGRVVDLVATGLGRPVVTGVLVSGRQHTLVPWSQIAAFDRKQVVLGQDSPPGSIGAEPHDCAWPGGPAARA